MTVRIERAILSVTDKRGLVDFAKVLAARKIEMLASGGTAKVLREAQLPVIEVAEYTGAPEILDGRVKTLHPRVHGGILARRDLKSHRAEMQEQGIKPIDLVIVNLYAFEQAAADQKAKPEDVIEQIDIGGPSMIRSAAKNHAHVAVVVDPDDYPAVAAEIEKTGAVSDELRQRLAAKAFARTAAYDGAIASYLAARTGSESTDAIATRALFADLEAEVQPLRYGENPHQRGFFVRRKTASCSSLHADVLWGKELSYNNLLDLDAALELVKELPRPAAAVIKHNNPCGASLGVSAADAFDGAYAGDPLSAFGGIVAFNVKLDPAAAARMTSAEKFLEAVIAPGYDPEALERLKNGARWSKNLRILSCRDLEPSGDAYLVRSVAGGLLVQTPDDSPEKELKVVTKRAPEEAELSSLKLAMAVAKYVRSNAITIVRGNQLVGVGAGQMSRVDACEIALRKASARSEKSVLASDAFFPFRDSIDLAAKAGIRAIIQPGGSVRDQEVIDAANEAEMAMVFTGVRHFRH